MNRQSQKPLKDVRFPPFQRNRYQGTEAFSQIGQGAVGGKASGLASMSALLNQIFSGNSFQGIELEIPRLTVLATDVFDHFMEMNRLHGLIDANLSDERLAHHFQQADLPADVLGDLWVFISRTHTPLAIRSSSLLEDSLEKPFAGVYATKMTPNNQPDAETRFHKLLEAIKFVYASTYFQNAQDYARATGCRPRDEKMAVIIQDVAGLKRQNAFYPDISGVARSFNPYPFGAARPEDGVVSLALGLGKTIVDGELSWTFSPAYPRATPPFGSTRDILRGTQTRFWCVDMNKRSRYNPVAEAEFLLNKDLDAAEYDNVLAPLASTYDAASDRLRMGVGIKGPRVLNFAPLLQFNDVPLTPLLKTLLAKCEENLQRPVEVEFAMTLGPEDRCRFHLLQMRPMAQNSSGLSIDMEALDESLKLAVSRHVLGSGENSEIRDVLMIKPETFDFQFTQRMAGEIDTFNRKLAGQNRPYLLAGFGRWGSADPWLGIPVNWSQVSGARVIIEATHPDRPVDLSQGSHFFHNLMNLNVFYFQIRDSLHEWIDWKWLNLLGGVEESEFIRHIRLEQPLKVMTSPQHRQGVILKSA